MRSQRDRTDRPARETRARRAVLIAVATLAIAAVITALIIAVTSPPRAASAITGVLTASASITAALTALFLSTAALTRSDRQLLAGVRALQASRLPYLAPLHESQMMPGSGSLMEYPPTEQRLPSMPNSSGIALFLADTRNRFLLPIENVGVGPALNLEGELGCSDGRVGRLTGAAFVAVGSRVTLAAEVHTASTSPPDEVVSMANAFDGRIYYWIELEYEDVFGIQHLSRAIFDSRGIGAWRQLSSPPEDTAKKCK